MATLVEDEAVLVVVVAEAIVEQAMVAVCICKQDQDVEAKVDAVVVEYMVAPVKGNWHWYNYSGGENYHGFGNWSNHRPRK